MADEELDQLVALLPAVLQSLEALGFIARNLNPPDFDAVMEAAGMPDATLRAVRARPLPVTDRYAGARTRLAAATDGVLAAFDGLRAAAEEPDGLRAVFRALRHVAPAMEALYPLADGVPPVSRFFLDPAARDDDALLARLAEAGTPANTGVIHADDERGRRGGFSLYVPETYTPDRAWPLVMALHGGSGNGRAFLWNWLPAARACGAIVVAPTAIGPTWALMGEDADTPNLERILALVRQRWTVDPARLLLTGMSDGGTFCYVTGLLPASPFTHLAPVAASFHPMMAQFADPDRLRRLPIHVVHGGLDWMFPVDVGRSAARSLAAAGAAVTYRGIDDLSHCYPREVNRELLSWLNA